AGDMLPFDAATEVMVKAAFVLNVATDAVAEPPLADVTLIVLAGMVCVLGCGPELSVKGKVTLSWPLDSVPSGAVMPGRNAWRGGVATLSREDAVIDSAPVNGLYTALSMSTSSTRGT